MDFSSTYSKCHLMANATWLLIHKLPFSRAAKVSKHIMGPVEIKEPFNILFNKYQGRKQKRQRPFERGREEEVFRKRRNGVVILGQLITRRVLAQKHCIVTGWTHVTAASTRTHTGTASAKMK